MRLKTVAEAPSWGVAKLSGNSLLRPYCPWTEEWQLSEREKRKVLVGNSRLKREKEEGPRNRNSKHKKNREEKNAF